MPVKAYLILRSARRARLAVRDAALRRLLTMRGRTMLVQVAVALSNSFAPSGKRRSDLGFRGELSSLGLAQPFPDVVDLPAMGAEIRRHRLVEDVGAVAIHARG